MSILTQFILRLSFGMALGMGLVSPRLVTSGYFRNHLYVLLGINVLAAMVAFAAPDQFRWQPPLIAAVLAYMGSVAWLYEKPKPGIAFLWLIAAVTLWGAWSASDWRRGDSTLTTALVALDAPTSGLVLGLTMAAMFLGHWYLNAPGMAIAPLEKLVWLTGAAVVARAAVEGGWLAEALAGGAHLSTGQWLFVALRWLAGIFGALGLVVMTLKTLKIPNTQSATGILYVGVIVTFLGELLSLLLATQAAYSL